MEVCTTVAASVARWKSSTGVDSSIHVPSVAFTFVGDSAALEVEEIVFRPPLNSSQPRAALRCAIVVEVAYHDRLSRANELLRNRDAFVVERIAVRAILLQVALLDEFSTHVIEFEAGLRPGLTSADYVLGAHCIADEGAGVPLEELGRSQSICTSISTRNSPP